MKKISLAILATIFYSSLIICGKKNGEVLPAEADIVKQKLQDKYDGDVEREKIKFLNHYNVSSNDLNNQELISNLKNSHDELCKKELKQYEPTTLANPQELSVIQRIASQVFKESNLDSVKVIHANEFEAEDICVSQIYATNECYVTLNCAKHINNVEQLAALLRHECSHLVYQDNLHKELIQCLGWVNSQDSRQEVERQSYPFSQAFEIRADVYAALHSSDHGRSLIQFLSQLPENPDILTHPTLSKRIAILEQIKDALDK